jgi:hypothetical protein
MQLLFVEMPECVAKVDASLARDSQIASLSCKPSMYWSGED